MLLSLCCRSGSSIVLCTEIETACFQYMSPIYLLHTRCKWPGNWTHAAGNKKPRRSFLVPPNIWVPPSRNRVFPSSETQGQILGARESLNGRKNKARKKVNNGEKSSSRRSLLFFVPYFSRPFRLSLAPTICPWVSEDGVYLERVYCLLLIFPRWKARCGPRRLFDRFLRVCNHTDLKIKVGGN